MHLYLNIGTEKTGTTSFQNWCAANRDALLEQGVYYCKSLGQSNHMRLYLYCLDRDSDDRGFTLLGLDDPIERTEAMDAVPGAIAKEVELARAAGCRHFVISNEHCHSHLVTHEQVARAGALLSPLFDDITVVCAVRPQIDVATSLASTAARAGAQISDAFFNRVKPTSRFYNYRDLARRWSEAFGKDNTRFYPFTRNKDTIGYFCTALQIDPEPMTIVPRQNEALDVRIIAIMNRYVSDEGVRPKHFGPAIRRYIDALPIRDKLDPGLAVAQDVQARFSDSNYEFIAENSLVNLDDLEPDWSKFSADGTLQCLAAGQDQKLVGAEALYEALEKLSF